MEEDDHSRLQTSDAGYLQPDFQQDSDPPANDIKDGVFEQADDSVHIKAEANVGPAQGSTDRGVLLDSPRKTDASATEDVTIGQDEISSPRKKGKKKVTLCLVPIIKIMGGITYLRIEKDL
jgi:hypothetical protein